MFIEHYDEGKKKFLADILSNHNEYNGTKERITISLVDTLFLAVFQTMAMGMDFLQDVMKRSVAEMPVQKACTTYLQCRKLAEEADRKESSEGESDWSEVCTLICLRNVII